MVFDRIDYGILLYKLLHIGFTSNFLLYFYLYRVTRKLKIITTYYSRMQYAEARFIQQEILLNTNTNSAKAFQ